MPEKREETEIICPECWGEFSIEDDELDDEIICEECGYGFYIEESVAD